MLKSTLYYKLEVEEKLSNNPALEKMHILCLVLIAEQHIERKEYTLKQIEDCYTNTYGEKMTKKIMKKLKKKA